MANNKIRKFNNRKRTPGRPVRFLPLYSGKTLAELEVWSETENRVKQFKELPSYAQVQLLRRMVRHNDVLRLI